MTTLHTYLEQLSIDGEQQKVDVVREIIEAIGNAGYSIVELNDQKPWGAYFRIDGSQASKFVAEFFPGLSIEDARLGVEDAELSPKILLVSPGQRLSWQYHNRRAERWMFLTAGAYNKSESDDPGQLKIANVGDVVQFGKSERHRLVGVKDTYTLVAEIWQHTDPLLASDEDDIIRLADDYKR